MTTPANLSILPRDRRFGRARRLDRWWLAGDPVATAFYNALSVTFPKGEGLFVDSVRRFRDGAPPRLRAEIAAFTKQEVAHTREHLAFNRQVTGAGYDVASLERAVDARLADLRAQPPIVSLAATIALEHFTAILAHALLADARHLDGAEPEAAAMWRWHAVEEIEHKGVAYDTWLQATAGWPRFRRWAVRSRVMLAVTRHFLVDRTRGALELLRQDGLTGPRIWVAMLRYALVSPGMLRRIGLAWADYFRPGFHPWDHDDRALIAGEQASAAREEPALA